MVRQDRLDCVLALITHGAEIDAADNDVTYLIHVINFFKNFSSVIYTFGGTFCKYYRSFICTEVSLELVVFLFYPNVCAFNQTHE